MTKVPQTPATPWTEAAPIASSIFSFFSINSIEKTTIIPPIRPANTEPTAVMFPHPAVILTRPARAPFNVWTKFGLPYHIHVVTRAPKAPAAAAKFVNNTTFEAAIASAPPQANWDPPLKPNHPNHRINTPKVARIWLWPGIGITFPSTNFPILGPTMYAPTKAAHPPTEWTIEDPAKSINSTGMKDAVFKNPPFHSQPPAIG